MVTYLKFLALGFLGSLLASVLGPIVGDLGTDVITLAAVLGSGLYVLNLARKAMVALYELIKRWMDTVQIIQALPPVVEHLATELAELKRQVTGIDEKADQIREPLTAVARELDVPHRGSR